MHRRTLGRLAALLLALVLVSGGSCDPVTPPDTSPGALDLKVIILDLTPTPSDGKVIVGMQFMSGGQVANVGTNVATCDGVNLTQNALLGNAYAERVPLRAPGQQYHFAYQHGGTTVTVDVPAPARPTITSPAPNAQVARSTTFTVTYPPGSGAAVIVSTDSSQGSNEHGEQPDTGTYGNINTTGVAAGAGSVALKRVFRQTLAGTAFKSATSEVTTMSGRVPITWV